MKKTCTMKVLALGLAVAMIGLRYVSEVSANPIGGAIAAGTASIEGSGANTLQINQVSDRVIINWEDFSIGAGEVTRFVQPSATAAALNRVVTGNPSALFGQLQANGEVILINPNGILVGAGGKIDTASFIASTFDIGDSSFETGGNLRFTGDSTASIQNLGKIGAFENDVFLIAHSVENKGEILAAGGTVGIAAGSDVILVEQGASRLAVQAGNAGATTEVGVSNQGLIEATEVEIKSAGGNIYALAINNEGAIRASTLVNDGGRIVLKANNGTVVNSGILDASGRASGGQGGTVHALGGHVGLIGDSLIDVSGDIGGGEVLVGGDFQGKNPEIENAEMTYLGRDAVIAADAISIGDGGKVIVWSDEGTAFFGRITAQGGIGGGNGGFAEVSGKNGLAFDGIANLMAHSGVSGELLLDPDTVTIGADGSNNSELDDNIINVGDFFFDGFSFDFDFEITGAKVVTQLGLGPVSIAAGSFITVNVAIGAGGSANNLTLNAPTVDVNAPITLGGGNFIASGTIFDGTGGSVDVGAGDVTLTFANITLPTMVANGILTVNGSGAIGQAGAITAGTALLAAGSGNNITLNNAANNFTTVQIGSANNVTLRDVNALDLGASTISGNLNVTTAGAVTDNGPLTVSGTTIIAAGGANDITLDSVNEFNTVSITSGNNVTLVDASAIVLGASTVSGTLNVTAGSDITQSGILNVTGASTFTVTGSDVLLGLFANTFAGVTIAVSGAGSIQDVSLRNDSVTAAFPTLPSGIRDLTLNFPNNLVDLPTLTLTGNLGVTAGGAITDSGNLVVPGTTILDATAANDITLNSAGNDFGTVTVVAGNNVTINDSNGVDFGASTVSGTFDVDAQGSITQSGVLAVTGASSFTIRSNPGNIQLRGFPNTFAGVTIAETAGGNVGNVGLRNISLTAALPTMPSGLIDLRLDFNNAAIDLPATTLTGSMSIVAGGDITQSGALSVDGANQTATFAAGVNNITLNDAMNDFASVLITSGNNIVVTDTDGVDLGLSTVNGTFDVTAGGAITQSGLLSITGASTFTVSAPNSDILLADFANLFASTTFATSGGGSVQDLGLRNASITAMLPALPAGLRNLTLAFDNAAIDLPTLTLTGGMSAFAAGDITQSGTLVVNGGAAVSTFSAGANNIILTDVANDFTTVVVSSGNSVTVNDVDDIVLGASIVTTDLTITAGDTVTQSGAIQVPSLVVKTFNDSGSAITLSDTGNEVSAVDLQVRDSGDTADAGAAITYVDATGFDIAGAHSGDTVTLTGGGAITESGSVTATILTVKTLDDAGGLISLGNAANEVATIDLQVRDSGDTANTAGAISYVDSTGFDVASIRTSSTASLIGGGIITQSGSIEGTTLTVKTLDDAGSAITLGDAANEVTAVILQARDSGDSANAAGAISYQDATGFDVIVAETTSTVNLIAGGAITESGAISATTLTAKTLDNAGASITLTSAGNEVAAIDLQSRDSGDISDSSGTVSYTDASGVDIVTIATTGNATLITRGAVTQSGSIAASTLTVKTLDDAGAAITLTDVGNDVSGVDLQTRNIADTANTGGAISYRDSDGFIVVLARTAGNITLQADAAVTQTGAIITSGLELLGSGSYVFTVPGNLVDTIAANVSGSVSLRDSDDLTIGTVNTVGITVVNNDVSIGTAGGGTLTIDDAISIGTGNLTLTLGGGATQNSGNSIVGAGLEILGSGSFLLADNSNDIDILAANISGDLNFRDIDGFSIGTVNTVGVTQIGASPLVLVAEDAITQTDPINIGTAQLIVVTFNDAGAAINLGNTGNVVGTIDLESLTSGSADAAGAITFQNNGDLEISIIRTTSTADITATGGQISQSQALTVGGTATFTADSFIFLDSFAGNDFSTVGFSTPSDVFVSDLNGINLGTSSIGSFFAVTANGAITQNGAVSMAGGGSAFIHAGISNDITLDHAGNDFDVVFIGSGDNVVLQDANALVLGSSTVGGNLDVTTSGVITQSGLITANGGGAVATFTAGSANNITLNNTGNDFTTVAIGSGNDVEICDINGVDLGASTISGDLTVCANGDITQSGAISANSGGSTVTLSTGGTSADVILPNTANDFDTVIITPNEARNVTIADANNLSLSLIIPGQLTVTVAGSLTQVDPFIAGGGQSIVNDISALVSVISYVELSAPTLTSSGFAAAEIDPSIFEDVLPPGSIWTSSLQEPFPKKRRVLKL